MKSDALIGRRVQSKQTGELGTVTKVINRCFWVIMPDGTTLSGGRSYWKLLPKEPVVEPLMNRLDAGGAIEDYQDEELKRRLRGDVLQDKHV